jgi:PAS domain S-box
MLSIDTPDEKLKWQLRFLASIILCSVALIDSLVIAGWVFHIPSLQALFCPFGAMPLSNALIILILAVAALIYLRGIVSGVSVWRVPAQWRAVAVRYAPQAWRMLVAWRLPKPWRVAVITLSISVITMVVLRLVEAVCPGWLGMDVLLANYLDNKHIPNLMSPISAICFLSLAFSLLGRQFRTPPAFVSVIAQHLPIVAIVICEGALIGWGYGTPSLYTWKLFSHIMFTTAALVFLLSVAYALLEPEQGPLRIFTKRSQGGYVARHLLPLALFLPILISLMEGFGPFTEVDFLCMIALTAISLPVSVYWVCYSLHRADLASSDAHRERTELAAIVEHSHDAIAALSLDGTILSWNLGAEQTYGYTPEQAIGSSFKILWPEDQMKEAKEFLNTVQMNHRDVLGNAYHGEAVRIRTNHVTCDGRKIRVSLAISPVLNADGSLEGASLISRDITEITRKEAMQTAVRITTAEESERLRIAHELHDEIGQQLATVGLCLQMALRTVESDSVASEQLLKLNGALGDLACDLRRVAFELRPSVLDALGLEAALERYTEGWMERTDIIVDYQFVGDRMPPFVESIIYRVVQEALTNIYKHAEATQVTVFILHLNNRLTVIVEDNGKGFDTSKQLREDALGLRGIKERLSLVDGELRIKSRIGQGTTLAITVSNFSEYIVRDGSAEQRLEGRGSQDQLSQGEPLDGQHSEDQGDNEQVKKNDKQPKERGQTATVIGR